MAESLHPPEPSTAEHTGASPQRAPSQGLGGATWTDELSALLAACDEALATGATPPCLHAVPAEFQPVLQRGLAALRLLDQFRPDGEPGGPRATANRPTLTRVGRFQIQGELGSGSFGVVYLAYDPQVRRDVALKVPRGDGLLFPDLRQRFQQEARAAGALDHPNLVPVYEAGEADGVLYIASAYCPGDTLAGWLSRHLTPVAPQLAGSLVATLAAAVQHAHQKGIIHRDLKPGNILLAAGELACENVRITDFGLARLLADEQSPGLTRSGAVVGTPWYMAPEQAAGKNREVGPAADVYALGAILYELLVRRPPFQADSYLEVLEEVRSREPVPPRQLRPGVPRDLETICLKCLQKELHRRYASARALADDLGRFLTGQSILARPVGPLERSVRWARRHPAVAGLLAALVLVTTLGVAGIFWKYLDAEAQKGEAIEAREEAQTQAEVAREQTRLAQEQERETSRQFARAGVAHYALQLTLALRDWQDGRPNFANATLQGCDRRFRHWEHGHLLRLCAGSERTIRSPHRAITDLAVHPGGLLVGGSVSGPVWVWNAHTGKLVRTLTGHADSILRVAVSPDTRLAASVARDGTLRIWDLERGVARHVLPCTLSRWSGVAFSPDSRLVVACTRDGAARFWDVQTGRERTFTQSTLFFQVCFHPNGKSLAGSSPDGRVWLLNAQTGAVVRQLSGRARVEELLFRPDGKELLASELGRTLLIWETTTGRLKRRLLLPVDCRAVCPSPNNRVLAMGQQDGSVQVLDASTGRILRTLQKHTGRVHAVAFLGDRLVSAAAESLKIWDLASSPEVRVSRKGSVVRQVAFSADGKYLGRVDTSDLLVEDVQTGQRLSSWGWRKFSADRLAFRPGSGHIALARRGEILVREVTTGREVRKFPFHATSSAHQIAYSPDGRYLAAAALNDAIVWEADTGRQVGTFKGHTSWVTGVCFSPDGQRLVTSSRDRTTRVWNLATGQGVSTLGGHGQQVMSVAFGRGGTLATGLGDGTTRLWDLATGQMVHTLRGHRVGDVRGLAFSSDGQRLATCATDGVVPIWDVRTGQTVFTLPRHTEAFTTLAFSPDGLRLATGSMGGLVKVWLATPMPE